MIKVLHYGLSMNSGGIENYLIKLWENIDHEQYEFLFTDSYDGKACFRKELERSGCQFFDITHRRKSVVRNYHDWKKVLRNSDIDILHCHLNTLSDIVPVLLGVKYGKKVIVHSRSSNMSKSFFTSVMHRINFLFLPRKKITMVAVSQKAGIWLFGRKTQFQVINNGVDTKKFCYDENVRSRLRGQYGMENCYVIGHIGAFLPVKNHKFILQVFSEFLKEKRKAKLVLIGEGILKEEIQSIAKGRGLEDNIMFLGKRVDVADWYSAMDILIFPSYFEAFPNVVLEAQAAGLPCVISENVTDEVMLCSICKKMSLDDAPQEWAKCLLSNITVENRKIYNNEIVAQGYDVFHEILKIQQLYDDISYAQ